MRLMILIFILEYSNFLGAEEGNCNNDVLLLYQMSILRRHLLDTIASSYHGSLLSTARINVFWRKDIDDNPLRFSLYYCYPTIVVGHIVMPLGGSAIVEFIQCYEINIIRFWMWEGGQRITNMQIFVIGCDGITETKIFDGFAQPGVQQILTYLDIAIFDKYKQLICVIYVCFSQFLKILLQSQRNFLYSEFKKQDFTIKEGIQQISSCQSSKFKPIMPFDLMFVYQKCFIYILQSAFCLFSRLLQLLLRFLISLKTERKMIIVVFNQNAKCLFIIEPYRLLHNLIMQIIFLVNNQIL